MIQENKELLLKDLSARLSYGVVMSTPNGDGHLCSINQTIFGNEYGINISATRRDYFNDEESNFKPYLRPMSSMTEEEKKKLGRISCEGNIEHKYGIFYRSQDYLNSIHVDYRGLIDRGLALEASEDMYK